YWGVGQLALTLSELVADARVSDFRLWLGACGLVAYYQGTLLFLGKQLSHKAWILVVVTLLLLVGDFFGGTGRLAFLLVWVMSGLWLWMGWQLAIHKSRYRIVGKFLVIRGVINLLVVLPLPAALIQGLHPFYRAAEVFSLLSMMYAVLAEMQDRYLQTVGSLSHGLAICDELGQLHLLNEQAAHLLGYESAASLRGHSLMRLFPHTTPQRILAYLHRVMQQRDLQAGPWVDEVEVMRFDGTLLPVELIASVYRERGQHYALIQVIDIRERRLALDRLRQAARIDTLTGLLNRRALLEEMEHVVHHALQKGQEVGVLYIDLDRFHHFNDALGHSGGDLLLSEVANRLCQLVKNDDILARVDGDEFVLVMPGCESGEALARIQAASTKVQQLFDQPFEIHSFSVRIRPSLGACICPLQAMDKETLLQQASLALYAAKDQKLREVCLFDQDMDVRNRYNLLLEEQMAMALQRREMHMVYQPIMDVDAHRFDKVEALLRWDNQELGRVDPDKFIPLAERHGMILPLGNFVVDQACQQLAAWRGTLLEHVKIAINISAWQLYDVHFMAHTLGCLQAYGVAAYQIELELTERVLIDDTQQTETLLGILRDLGFGLSVDDFGTGYSAMSYLTRFPLTTLKIDRAFVRDVATNERSRMLASAIIALGRSLGMMVIAEGVELVSQQQELQHLGCNLMQGYYFARPMPAEALLDSVMHDRLRL
ncbi:MAG: EAL domain-containing protein, partial [Pseudomonadales bacterium]|nr:EAL domain-containing protein [Pseudomonadales bacterium]